MTEDVGTPGVLLRSTDRGRWLEEAVATGTWTFPIPEIRVHSANPVGRRRMEQAIDSIQRRDARGS
jgi:hypothetical protein